MGGSGEGGGTLVRERQLESGGGGPADVPALCLGLAGVLHALLCCGAQGHPRRELVRVDAGDGGPCGNVTPLGELALVCVCRGVRVGSAHVFGTEEVEFGPSRLGAFSGPQGSEVERPWGLW